MPEMAAAFGWDVDFGAAFSAFSDSFDAVRDFDDSPIPWEMKVGGGISSTISSGRNMSVFGAEIVGRGFPSLYLWPCPLFNRELSGGRPFCQISRWDASTE